MYHLSGTIFTYAAYCSWGCRGVSSVNFYTLFHVFWWPLLVLNFRPILVYLITTLKDEANFARFVNYTTILSPTGLKFKS